VNAAFRLREIPGAPGYDVSDDGRVFSRWYQEPLGRCKGSRAVLRAISRELTQFDRRKLDGSPSGYRSVKVARKNRYVHELVLLAFVGPRPSPNHEVCHGNSDRADNRLENLRWGTVKENCADRIAAGTQYTGPNWVHPFADLIGVEP